MIVPIRRYIQLSAVLFALGIGAGESWAVPITNAGFETQVLADGTFTSGTLTGWTITGGTSAGAFNPTVSHFPGQAPEGQNTAYSNGPTISQILSDTLQANTNYTLLVEVGDRLDTAFPGYAVEFRAGGALLASESALIPPNGTFLTSQINFFAPAGHPNLGQALEIRLLSSGTQTNYDNVRLEATVIPEPVTLLLVGFGLIGLGAWQRVKKS